MSASPSQDVLDYLREQFAPMDANLDRIGADMADMKERLDAMEGQVIGLTVRRPDPSPSQDPTP